MPLTVLHVNSERSWRGGEAQTLLLMQGLQARGHRCLLAAPPGSPLLGRAQDARIGVAPIRMRGEWDLQAARRLGERIRAERVDLLHYHTAHAVGLGTLATLICGRRPAVATRRVSFPLRGWWFGRFKYSYRVDRVVAVSEAIRGSLIAQGLSPDRVVTVHSGIDPARFTTGDGIRFRASLPSASRGPGEALLIGTVGHLAAHKGIDLFLRAAALALREIPSARFVIIGRGEREESLRRLADTLGMGERVVFTGFREDMPDVLAGLDLLVLASSSGEGSPAVLKEAMAAGLPLVATAIDGIEEIVEDGRHGLLTPRGDAPAMARAMVLLAQDEQLRSRLTAAARDRVLAFTVDRMVLGNEQVYLSVGDSR